MSMNASTYDISFAPFDVLAGSMTLVAAAMAAWKREAWTRAGRIHFALVAAASAAFTAVVFGSISTATAFVDPLRASSP